MNKPPFEAFGAEIGVVLSEIDYVVKRLKSWAKPEKTKNLAR